MRNSQRYPSTFNMFPCKAEYFKNYFFPHVINERNKLDPSVCSFTNYHIFRNALLKFKRPAARKIVTIIDPFGIIMLTRLRLGFSHLLAHKFIHGFKDMLNPFGSYSIEAENITHYSLRCNFYNSSRVTLMNHLILILISTIRFIKDSQ